MELPHIGQNCALRECNQLDFLPVKCDACSAVFCLEHYRYEKHSCEAAKGKDNQVPVCPLCMQPVMNKRDELPDQAVSQHIDKYCTKNELLKNYQQNKTKTNLQTCSFRSCRQRDVIYLECNDCKLKYCIKHRHPSDHSCVGPTTRIGASMANNWNSIKETCSVNVFSSYSMVKNKAQQLTKSGQATLNRIATTSGGTQANQTRTDDRFSMGDHRVLVNELQGELSEQDALEIAMRESARGVDQNETIRTDKMQEEDDAALAQALHKSQLESQNRPRTSLKPGCILS